MNNFELATIILSALCAFGAEIAEERGRSRLSALLIILSIAFMAATLCEVVHYQTFRRWAV